MTQDRSIMHVISENKEEPFKLLQAIIIPGWKIILNFLMM